MHTNFKTGDAACKLIFEFPSAGGRGVGVALFKFPRRKENRKGMRGSQF